MCPNSSHLIADTWNPDHYNIKNYAQNNRKNIVHPGADDY